MRLSTLALLASGMAACTSVLHANAQGAQPAATSAPATATVGSAAAAANPAATTPAPVDPAAVVPAAVDPATAAAAMALMENNCIRCHELSLVLAARHTPDEWKATVARMIEHGAMVTSEEADTVAAYLTVTRPAG